jgi:phage repressor protein C with HTH and peptisase S24 domain
MNLAAVAASVKLGRRVTFKANGNSMTPLVRDREIVTVRPLLVPPERGDIVLARVNGRWYLHLVSAVRKGQVQISNNQGHVNGWTATKNVVGILVR